MGVARGGLGGQRIGDAPIKTSKGGGRSDVLTRSVVVKLDEPERTHSRVAALILRVLDVGHSIILVVTAKHPSQATLGRARYAQLLSEGLRQRVDLQPKDGKFRPVGAGGGSQG